ncbi:conserved hypothetical protein [Sulfurovum sp. enrichment culture clone C5]|uniref:Uncharacterized protein n=1 Tax=Sulfurovum sp. enrichment culture clone C5 TaxID=497650 RepID=A0A0S4XQ50_9BACT|nr:conserved hypothetical protein [Sulfurovum sp. enrichment culture clone C5]
MGVKDYIFSKITRMPNSINYVLMKVNIFPSLVLGKHYIEYKYSIEKNSNADNHKKLINLINNALTHVKYYKEKYPKLQISSLEEFQAKIDFIDKDIVMQDVDAFISDDINFNDFIKGTTGGTSGKPLQLIIPKNRHIIELGTVHLYWEQYGYSFSPRAVLRNHKLKQKSFYINPISKEVIFDGFNLTDENFKIIYQTMKKYKIKFLQCYPSSGYAYAKYLKNNNLDTSFIKSFFVSSENILDYQKDFIKGLGIELFSLYGHSEKLVIGGYCPHHDYYHINPSYGYLELIDENNALINQPGVLGEIVGTTFNNYGMPLVRYRTGDYAEYIDINCECGFKGKTLKTIQGRWSGEKVYNKDGTYVTTTALNLHNELYSVIDGIQYIQKEKGQLEIHIVPGHQFNDQHGKEIIEHFQNKMNAGSTIIVQKVKALKKEDNGKFLLLISKITK